MTTGFTRWGWLRPAGWPPPRALVNDWHAGEAETSSLLASHPQLAHQDQAKSESGSELGGQKPFQNVHRNLAVLPDGWDG